MRRSLIDPTVFEPQGNFFRVGMSIPGVFKGKVVFVGDAAVGKTSIITAYRGLTDPVSPTIAAHSVALNVPYSGGTTTISVFDTAGQDDYRCLVPLYARGAHVAVVVYAEDCGSSFDHIPQWLDFLSAKSRVPHTILVGNKSDLPLAVPAEKSDGFAEAQGLPLIRTSAKTRQNLDVLFAAIGELVERKTPAEDSDSGVSLVESTPRGSGCCHV
jgi:small GTP-binding protein